ncbi:ATP-binding cassette domain-containing protein [Sphaerisporangium sp. NPDC051017]|uniref:ATP-binding cassette domain-containing protein n=1 Tax=Sphaerisporangium sp. NPDC051017 TaxID=3154636 RepID=UPI00343F58A4
MQGETGYLPQSLPLLDGTVDQALEIAPIRAALNAIESGDVREEHFTVVGDNWDIEERTAAVLDRLGLGDVTPDRPLRTLSGGQVLSIGLAAQLLKRPDVLLLDEPTNNLDRAARERLYRVVEEWKGCLLVISHDRALLERMDAIAELHSTELRLYGGGFTAYTEAVDREQEAAQRAVRGAEQDLRRQKREAQEARERAQRRASNAKRNKSSLGLPRIIAGGLQRQAQESAGRSAEVHQQRTADAKARLEEATRELREEARIAITLPETRVPAGRTMLTCEDVNVSYGGGPLFAPPGLTLSVRGPERIALLGPNGSGKSTLLKLITGELEPATGTLHRAAEPQPAASGP